MTSSHTTPAHGHWFSRLASALDPRSAPRLALLLLGAVLARGRRTVTSWIRSAGLSDDYRPCYTTVAAAGTRADGVASRLVQDVVKPLVANAGRVVLALDDTPTERVGPTVQGAGVHHDPTPGPSGSPFLYGHVWVVLAVLATHPSWGVIALPVLARLSIRRRDLGELGPTFRTKLELAVELLAWAKSWLGLLGKPLWVVADGAYAKAPLLKAARRLGVSVVSRLRKDSALWDGPEARSGKRGRPRVYGPNRISLAKRAGPKRGWTRGTFLLYGKPTTKRYKTFLATWRPAGGVIRVVLVAESKGWVAFVCTDASASVADILGLVADRFGLETAFRDCKGVVGAGQQQVRRVRASGGAFPVCLWVVTLTEAWAWGRSSDTVVGHRSASPWDDPTRRPSHADKRRAWRRELLAEEIRAVLSGEANETEIQATVERLLDLAV